MSREDDPPKDPGEKREGEDKAAGEDDITRINFTVPKRMKEQWQDMAKEMATSISQLIRNAVQAYGKDIEKDLKEAGTEIEKAGQEMEKAFHEFGLDETGTLDHPRRGSIVAHAMDAARSSAMDAMRARATDPLDQLRKLKELLDLGAITDEEYKAKKAKLLDMV